MTNSVVTHKGKIIELGETEIWLVQIGRYDKGSYKTKYRFVSPTVSEAAKYYVGINIGRGYKKRLVLLRDKNVVIARQFSA